MSESRHYSTRTEGTVQLFLAVEDGATLGALRLAPSPVRANVWELASLDVARGYRRQGIARELHRRALEWVIERGGFLRATRPAEPAYAAVWKRLRDQRVAIEGGVFHDDLRADSREGAPPSPEAVLTRTSR